MFSLRCNHCGQVRDYSNQQVYAESGQLQMGGAVLGGLIGLAASGGSAAVLGAIIGGILGQSAEQQELAAVGVFNNSH
jgi:outer membrane lipoprotein SlyB